MNLIRSVPVLESMSEATALFVLQAEYAAVGTGLKAYVVAGAVPGTVTGSRSRCSCR